MEIKKPVFFFPPDKTSDVVILRDMPLPGQKPDVMTTIRLKTDDRELLLSSLRRRNTQVLPKRER